MTTEFLSLGLHPQVVQAVAELGFTEPTPIQTAVIPLMLNGQDIIGQAQTGTGKTAAFGLPILHRLTPGAGRVQALVVTPTRELALQVAGALEGYGRYRDVHVLAIYGGQAYGRQKRQLRQGEVDIVVGTPGRLLDLIQQKILDLSQVQFLVLDEADEMLSMGFIEDIEAILAQTPETRQTALFSATMPAEIRHLAEKYLQQPQTVTMQRQQLTVAAIEQRYYLVNEADKLAALTRLFEVEEMSSVLIFARTRQGTGELANELTVRGFPAEALNGDLSQDNREQVLNRFRQNQIKVLVATDVAARGLDIEDISHVINFDLPTDPEIFVHRIGRTGRAGKTGIAISLVTPKEQFRRRKIERYTRQNMSQRPLPTIAEIQAYREAQLVENMMVWLRRGRCRQEKEMVEKLVAEGYDVVEIAAAALKLARAEEKQRPIFPVSEVVEEPMRARNGRDHQRAASHDLGHGHFGKLSAGRAHKTRSHEKGMVRLSLSAGKQHGIRPNDVVGTIAFHADIPGRAIGAIQIQEQHTLVDVPEQFVAQVLAKNGKYQVRKRPLTVERV
ncbi:MAG: DEAD/DEAH box helicase [Chloroflexi bacterium]|nr:DEAD/DEAH box helicase [Chloroflexota bacterium]NOG34679.1 DEAD/DEAH box helicase [Chloroflexota bacterium]GIK57741.1 MAG: DEAD-box ATP-dependent RNA helicase CshA [Chloroflexota bacterium]